MDHNATTPLAMEVYNAMQDWLIPGRVQNASSVHMEGRAARDTVEESRESVAQALGGKTREIIFTSGATEANHLAIYGATEADEHVITTAVEHPSVLAAVEARADHSILPVGVDGRVSVASLADALTEKTRLVSILWGNNETGVLQDIEAIGRLCRERNVLLHVDAVQVFGRLPFRVADLPIDMITVSGHKMYGPQGVGALWVRTGVSLVPTLSGGHQERGRRAGTENVAAIAGFGAACERLPALLSEQERIAQLRDRLWGGLAAVDGIQRNGCADAALPNTLNVSFSGVEGEAMLMGLDLAGVSVSSGSACTAGSLEPSHVLMAMGLSGQHARGAVRFSLGTQNTAEEVDEVISRVLDVVERMRRAA